MQKLKFSIHINAEKEKVWNNMLDDATYREWTTVFNPGSHYEGSWENGSEMRFLGPDPKTGEMGGLMSVIEENKPFDFVAIKHIGVINNGVVDTTSEEVKKWTPAYENYTFRDEDGGTLLFVELDIDESLGDMFNEMWPLALKKLKEITEDSTTV